MSDYKDLNRIVRLKLLVVSFALVIFAVIGIAIAKFFSKDYPFETEIIGSVITGILVGGFANIIVVLVTKKDVEKSNEDIIRKSINKVFDTTATERSENIRRSGIVDAYEFMDEAKLCEKIRLCDHGKIRILKIWIHEMGKILPALETAINENHIPVEIILWHPDCTDALRSRAIAMSDRIIANNESAVEHLAEHSRSEIIANLRILEGLKSRLENKNLLKVRLNKGFISFSAYQIGDTFLIGLYFNRVYATDSTQLVVRGTDTLLHKSIDDHFSDCFSKAVDYKLRDFTDTPIDEYDISI